jgi:hypothetical protein
MTGACGSFADDKADVLAPRLGGQHVADLDLGMGDGHALNEQQHERPALLECGLGTNGAVMEGWEDGNDRLGSHHDGGIDELEHGGRRPEHGIGVQRELTGRFPDARSV